MKTKYLLIVPLLLSISVSSMEKPNNEEQEDYDNAVVVKDKVSTLQSLCIKYFINKFLSPDFLEKFGQNNNYLDSFGIPSHLNEEFVQFLQNDPRLWQLIPMKSSAISRTGFHSYIHHLSWSPAGTHVAFQNGLPGSPICILDVNSGALQKIDGDDFLTISFCWNPTGMQIALGGAGNAIRIWDIKSGIFLNSLNGHTQAIFSVSWHPNGKHIASASHDKTVRIWDAQSGICQQILKGHAYGVHEVSWSATGEQLASVSNPMPNQATNEQGIVYIWDIDLGTSKNTLKHVFKSHTHKVQSISWNPANMQIASTSEDGVRIWDTKSGKCLKNLITTPNAFVTKADWNASGTQIISEANCITRIWDCKTGECLHIFPETVRCASWSPTGTQIAFVSHTGDPDFFNNRAGIIHIYDISYAIKGKTLLKDALRKCLKRGFYTEIATNMINGAMGFMTYMGMNYWKS